MLSMELKRSFSFVRPTADHAFAGFFAVRAFADNDPNRQFHRWRQLS